MPKNTPKVEMFTLSNGLRVISAPDRTVPLVGVNLWYNVGSRDEVAGKTGFAHLFEHLMFQGSRNVKSAEHFSYVENVGGTLNGTTSFDRTNYYETVPTHAAELALWLEADRMGTLQEAISQESLDNQRDVVKNERRQRYDNVPYGTSWERLVAAAFPTGHHYQHMPIGSMEHLDAANLDDVHEFFVRHYTPGNAVLSIAGDLSSADAFRLAEKYFGMIPAKDTPVRKVAPMLGAFESYESVIAKEDVPLNRMTLAWRVPPAPAKVNLALELTFRILTEGASSRLTSRIVRNDELVNHVSGSTLGLTGGVDLGIISVTGKDNVDLDDVTNVILEEIEKLAKSGPSAEELQRAKIQHRRQTLEEVSDVGSVADETSRGLTLFNDPLYTWKRDDVVDTFTAEDIQLAAHELLNPYLTLTYLKDTK